MVKVLQAQSSNGMTSSAARSAADRSSAGINEPYTTSTVSGHLSKQTGGRMRYVEQTFWASMCPEASDLDGLLTSQTQSLLHSSTNGPSDQNAVDNNFEEDYAATYRRDAAARRSRDDRQSGQPSKTTHSRVLGDIVSQSPAWKPGDPATAHTVAHNPDFMRQMPSKRRCDALLNGYIKGYHPMAPIMHVPTFTHRYEEFWRTRDDPNASITASMTFAALLVAVLYAGSVACPDAVSSGAVGAPDSEEAATHLHTLTMRALRLSNFPRIPTLDSFRAYLLCQSTWIRAEEPAFVGLALRIATMLGLHRDPSHFRGMGAVECEVRRRVWWQLVHIDVLVAIASGLAPMIDPNTWDVQTISELKEEYFGAPLDARDPVNKSMVSTIGILLAGKLRTTMVLRRTLARILGRGPLITSESIAMRSEFRLLGEDLTARIARIPEPGSRDMGQAEATTSYEHNPALNRWARLLLSAYVDENYSIACQPILKGPVSQKWPELYPQAIEHCQKFLNKCAQMASIPDFRHFHWSWPDNHQPLHAIMVLLVDLNQTTDSDSAAASRKAIDIVFALCGPNRGIVGVGATVEQQTKRPLTEGGQEAWEYFRRLRSKAWHKAGLDPDIVWSREQAVQYCSQQPEPEVCRPEVGPLWNQATAATMEGLIQHGMQNDFQGLSGTTTSPPNIDWTYLDAVLEGHQGYMDIGFGYDFGDPRSGM